MGVCVYVYDDTHVYEVVFLAIFHTGTDGNWALNSDLLRVLSQLN